MFLHGSVRKLEPATLQSQLDHDAI